MAGIPKAVEKRARELTRLIQYHQKRYHEDDAPEISDEAYDSLVLELSKLRDTHPPLLVGQDVLESVGGSPNRAFSKVTHRVKQWSFDNIFTKEELTLWVERIRRRLREVDRTEEPSFMCEHKIDGLKVILEYTDGRLIRASTRGDGEVGEDVTHTVMTVKDVPKTLKKAMSVIVVGEAWLPGDELTRINLVRKREGEALFANPRNAAAGSLRQLDASVTASRGIRFFAYDIDWGEGSMPDTQEEELSLLRALGFVVNTHARHARRVEDILRYYEESLKTRDVLPYGVDGIVLKVNQVPLQHALGHTAKSPRFGVAFKFPSVEATTELLDIVLQVGRTGVVTPVAVLKPVLIAGSVVARATLHNEDQIERLDVRIGDTVILQKAGDVIPEIISVLLPLRPKKARRYAFPTHVPSCGGDGRIERIPGESAYRCVDRSSGVLHRRRLHHFVSKHALNMDGLGPKIVDALMEAGMVASASDLFSLQPADFLSLPGFKEKSATNAYSAIEKSRDTTLARLLVGLSIDHVGETVAELIAERAETISGFETLSREELIAIQGVGDIVADAVLAWRKVKAHREELHRLSKVLRIHAPTTKRDARFKGRTFVFTGTLETLSRDDAARRVKALGAHVSGSVSRETDFVVYGDSPGSKYDKALQLGVRCVSEKEFLALL